MYFEYDFDLWKHIIWISWWWNVHSYGLLISYFENCKDNYQNLIFNAKFGTIKNSLLVNISHRLLFQHKFP
jgi:hypothetical protein